MIETPNFLKMYRKQSGIPQHDIAYLLNIDSGNLSRYEKGQRKPTPEIILTYHILFGASLNDLLHYQHKEVTENIITRSRKLITQLNIEKPPKSNIRIGYLNRVVKILNKKKDG